MELLAETSSGGSCEACSVPRTVLSEQSCERPAEVSISIHSGVEVNIQLTGHTSSFCDS